MQRSVKRIHSNFLNSSIDSSQIFCREKFSEEQKAIGAMVRKFSLERIAPLAERLNHYDSALSLKLMKEMGELGLIGINIPEEYGGSPMDKVSTAIIEEELAYCGSPSFGVTFGCQINIGSLAIVWFGTHEQKKKYLPKLASAQWIGAFGLTEPTAGSDAMSGKTQAILTDDGKHYKLNGQKSFITNGSWADVFTVFCQVDEHKFSCFILEKGMPGFEIGNEEKKMGMKGSSTVQLFFNDVMVPKKNLIHEIGKGAEVAFNVLGITRLKFGSSLVGACKYTINHAVNYAKERIQFGQPIANFGAIKSKLADMIIQTYALDSMSYRILGMVNEEVDNLDKDNPNYYQTVGLLLRHYMMEMSMAKVLGSETIGNVVDHGLQIYGGYGFIEEYPMAGPYRDSRIHRIWDGSNEINRQIIAKTILSGVLKEKLKLDGDLSESNSNGNFLKKEFNSVLEGKKLIALIVNSAIVVSRKSVLMNQHLQENLANMLIDLFTLESTLSRIAVVSKNKEINIKIGKSLNMQSSDRLLIAGKYCLLNIFNGKIPYQLNKNLQKISGNIDTRADLFTLKENIADNVIAIGAYPF